jgi:hypothetical protein
MAIWTILWHFGLYFGIYFVSIWYILWIFGIFYGYLVYFVVIWYIFDMLHKEKSGNPAPDAHAVGDPLGDALRGDASRLRHDDPDFRSSLLSVVQNELRHHRRLAAAGRTGNDAHRVREDGVLRRREK